MIIWGELFAHGDESTGLMKVVFCYALPTVVQGFSANETLHFRTTTCWAQLLLCGGVTVWGCFSFDCKLDLYVLGGNLTGQKYRDNVLAPRVDPISTIMRWLTGQCSWTTTLGHKKNQLSFANTNVEKYTWHFAHPVIYT
jgi:hypothetical protein